MRRTAAIQLDRWGERGALAWLLEDLRRTDRYFDQEPGKLARFEAVRELGRILRGVSGYRPDRDPASEENVAALKELERQCRELAGDAWPEELPRVARAGPGSEGAVFGLELRSCYVGELYLAWTADDVLLVGTGNPERVALAAGTTERLQQRFRAAVDQVEPSYGSPGCDLEVFRLRDRERVRAVYLSKGPKPVPGLRPDVLAELAQELLTTIPDEELRGRAREALEKIGGSLGE